MKVVVAMRQLADLVEELEIDSSGTDIDREFIKFVTNEWDEAALEEALCIKDANGAEVIVVGLDEPEFDQTLYSALAKGSDRAVKLEGVSGGWISSRERAKILADWISSEGFDLVLTGVQAADDLDGGVAGALAAELGCPHAAVVVSSTVEGNTIALVQELGGGITAESKATLPIVLGIQTARQAPRYVPIAKIRQAMQSGGIEKSQASGVSAKAPKVRQLHYPASTGGAQMLSGGAAEVADQIVEIIKSKGLLN